MCSIDLSKNRLIVKQLADISRFAVLTKFYGQTDVMRRTVVVSLHLKQVESFEKGIEETLIPFFRNQIESAVSRLNSIRKTSTSSLSMKETSDRLAFQIFNPREWDRELINRVFPIIAKNSAEAMMAEWMLLTDEMKEKSTTATDWLAGEDVIDLDELVFDTPDGPVRLDFITEYPEWMKLKIKEHLRESFSQDYWARVNDTTLGDISQYLERGLMEGWSIERMAEEMLHQIPGGRRYAKRRGRLIARTESGHALNSARTSAMKGFQEKLEGVASSRRVWLSVLGNTTRPEHADLDGVPEDSDGMWDLAGTRVRWPSDINLPPEQRCNCQCTVILSLGMSDSEANDLLAQYTERQESFESE